MGIYSRPSEVKSKSFLSYLMKKFKRHKTLFVCLLIFFLALGIRAYGLSLSDMHPDEMLWTERGLMIFREYSEGFHLGHPGILPAYLIGSSLSFFGRGISELSLNILNPLTAARLPILLLGSFTPVIIFIGIKKILNLKIALIASLLLTFDPSHIAYSRIAHLDVVLTFFLTSSVLLLFFWSRKRKFKFLILSGFTAGLAILTKKPGFAIFIFAGLWILINEISIKKKFSTLIKHIRKNVVAPYLIFLFIAIFVFIVGYPRLWHSPITSLMEFFFGTVETATGGAPHEIGNFWMGEVVASPPASFCLVMSFISLTELTVIFLFLGIGYSLIKICESPRNSFYLFLFLWLAVFLIPMSLAEKKLGIRYILPIWPVFCILAALGIEKTHSNIKKHFKKFRSTVSITFIVLIGIGMVISLIQIYPHYDNYNNEFIGGAEGASEIWLKFGGYSEAVEFITRNYGEDADILVLGNLNIPKYYYGGELNSNGKVIPGSGSIRGASRDLWMDDEFRDFDFLIMELSWIQRNPDHPAVLWTENETPVYTATRNGLETMFVYKI